MPKNNSVTVFTRFELIRGNQQRRGKNIIQPSSPRLGLRGADQPSLKKVETIAKQNNTVKRKFKESVAIT